MPLHIRRLLALIAAFAVVAVGARFIIVDKSFGVYGHFRADAVAEIAGDTPIFRGSAYCQSCHSERHATWSASKHKTVTCETCHGAVGQHPATGKASVAANAPMHKVISRTRYDKIPGKPIVPTDTAKLCSLCHEKMPGRPAAQPQVVVAQHAGTQQCITCHNPHSPTLAIAAAPKGMQAGKASAGKAKAAACAGCHGADGVSPNPAWPNLAGQQAAYFVTALKAYQTGARQDAMMSGLVKELSDADIESLAAYYTSTGCR